MVGNNNAGVVFEDLKNGLAAPLSGMGISFSSSLFGLAGSLILGFLDLQAGQAQNRFYNELEDWLAATVTETNRADPVHIERDLMALHPQESWISLSHRLIHHGRQICIARRPRCEECPLASDCPAAGD